MNQSNAGRIYKKIWAKTYNRIIKSARTTAALIALFLFSGRMLFAQQPVQIPKLSQTLEFDGKLDEPFWQVLQPLEMTMYLPVYRGTKSEKDEIYLVYDEQYIYLAARLYYNDTSDIRSNSLYRDEYSSDDTFALILDTFNDNENAMWFFVNPAGTRFDQLISSDGNGSNSDWDTYWDVYTAHYDWGWSVEMRIPFTSLNFQSRNGEAVMGAVIYRYLSKSNERYVYPAISPETKDGFKRPSLAQKIKLTGIENKNPIYITPYVLGGVKNTSFLNADSTAYYDRTKWTLEPGLDIKMNVTSNITLDLTANTDFAQVESDNQQVNLTRFPLFFPEKRQFFQERSSLFDFEFTMGNKLFHSRRIGLSSAGEPIQIYGGARAVGKFGKTDIGFINMQTAASATAPSENFNVVRVKSRILNDYSTVGGMFTSRLGDYDIGSNNFAYGVDANIRVVGDEYLTVKVAQTQESALPDSVTNSLISKSRFYMQWDRRRDQGFSYQIRFDRSGSNFDPQVGFIIRRNFTLLENHSGYKVMASENSIWRDFALHNLINVYFRNVDNRIETAEINPHLHLDTKRGTSFLFQFHNKYESLTNTYYVSREGNVFVEASEYWFHEFEYSYKAPGGWMLRPEISGNIGGFFDGSRITSKLALKWNPSQHFELGNEYEYNRVHFGKRNQEFETHLVRLHLRMALNTKISLTTFTQYNSEAGKVSLNARFRYNMAQGDDLWIVYDNVVNTERDQYGLPRMPLSGYQAMLVKFTKTFKY